MKNLLLSFLLLFTVTFAFGQNCPGYANAAVSPVDACGNQIYYLEVENTACAGLIWFDITGNSGDWGNEITWTVTSVLTGNLIASGGPYADNVPIGVPVGPIDPTIEGQYFTITVYDSWGDGFNGAGFIQIQQGATIYAYQDAAWSTDEWAMIFGANIDIYSSTITVTTPTGPVVSTASNCLDHWVALSLDNTNFCNTLSVSLPWQIVCDGTGAVIASGTQNVTVYPQIASSSSDVVTVDWNPASCQWDVSPQNDCNLLDIGTIFTISPDPATLPIDACAGGSQDFTIDYVGFAGGPDCCSTGGPLMPIVYNASTNVGDATVQNSPFGGTNNSAYSVIGGYGIGGNATSLTLTVDMTGYCFDPPGIATDEWWVTVYVDGNIISDVMFTNPPNSFSQTFNLGDIPGGYNENSIIEVYIYPNSFSAGPVNTTYVPGVGCGALTDGQWTAGTIDLSLTVNFSQMAPSPAVCGFLTPSPIVCCTPTNVLDDSDLVCSGSGTGSLGAWQTNIASANASCIVYSSVTPTGGGTAPDGVLPDGINGGGAPINQSVGAYAYCDSDDSGTDNAGDTYTLLSSFTLTVDPIDDPAFTTTPNCTGGTATITGTAGGVFSFGTPPGDGAVIDPATGEVTNGTPGATYDILYTTQGACPANQNTPLTVTSQDDPSFTLTPTCDGGTASIQGMAGGTFSFNTPPGDAAVIDPVSGTITGGTSGNTYDVLYVTNGPCPSSTTQMVTANLADDPSFTMTPTCVGATIASVVTAGGTYSFNPLPGDGAQIDPNTGEITLGTPGTTYTVEYVTGGSCSASTTINVTLTNNDDPSFTMTSTCAGATVATVVTAGGTFSFNPVPGDGAQIDPNTGEITLGTPGSSYTVEYITGGACSASTTIIVTMTNADDPSFTMTPTCVGATIASVTTAGGSFSFNPAPGDGAIIDSFTGEVTLGTPGTTYTVEYITGGPCSASMTVDVTLSFTDDPTFSLSPTCNGAQVSSLATPGGTYSFNVAPTDAAVIDPATGTITGGTAGANYDVLYITGGPCSASSVQSVIAMDCPPPPPVIDPVIPTAFTPDGDGANDDWNLLYLDLSYPDNNVLVYNRWGNLIFEHNSSASAPYDMNRWDGTFKNNKLPVGSYYFIIELNDPDGQKLTGAVSLVLNK